MPFTSWSSIFKTGKRSVASEDYPELEEILVSRPPLVPHQGAVDGQCALCNDEPATQEIGGTTVGDRCAERLMGVPGASPTPYTEFGQKVYGAIEDRFPNREEQEEARLRSSWQREEPYRDLQHLMDNTEEAVPIDPEHLQVERRADYPTHQDVLRNSAPARWIPPEQMRMHRWNSLHADAGIMDWLERKWGPLSYPSGGRWSFDWCRYRHNSHCYYPGGLNGPATSLGGYPVFTPQDRGTCPRITWDQQKVCPIGAPGPNSGEMLGAPDAISLQQQQNKSFQPGGGGLLHRLFGSKETYHALPGAPEPCANCGKSVKFDEPGGPGDESECYVAADGSWECPSGDPHDPVGDSSEHYGSRKDQDFHWHFLAKWADVRAKASRIRKEGGVRIISAPSGVNPYIVAEVKGDNHTYQSTILRSLGRKSVAGWECTCAWAHYAWGRSGRWKKFEGRMCSHALATVFQAQADEMLGGTIKEVSERPKHFENPADYTYKPQPYKEEWAVGRPKGTEGLENAWKRTTSALEKAAHGDLDHMLHVHCPNCGARHVHDVGWDTGSCGACGSTFAADEAHQGASLLGSFSHERPIAVEAQARLEEGAHPNVVLAYLRAEEAPWPEYLLAEALHQPFVARDPADELHTIVEVDGEHAVTDIGERIPVEHLTHPDFDWHSGLEPDSQLHMKSAKVVEDPAPHLNKDGSPHSGVMVALVPSRHIREGLAVQDGEPPEDMHVTVGYLGNKDGIDADALHRAVSGFAKEAPSLSGKISGFGNFEVDPERNDGFSHAHVGLVDIPGIADFRAKLDEHLGREGLKVNEEHGLQPHLTVAYGHEPMEYDRMPETTSGFDLPHVTVAHGSTWTHYPLEGSKPTKEGMLHWGRGRWDPGQVISPQNQPGGNENWNATHWERLPEAERQRQETRPLAEHGLTHEKMVQNIIDEHRYGSKNQEQYNADGNWYEDQHHAIKQIARSSVQGRPKGVGTANWTRSVFGATASLSPNTLWHHNITLAHYMAHNYHKYNHIEDPEQASESLWRDAQKEGLRSYNPDKDRHEGLQGPGFQNMAKAMTMLRGHGDPHHVIGGHKVRSFFNNLIDPKNEQGQDSVTTDRHHFGVLAGAFLGASKDPSDPNGKRKLDAASRIFGTEIRGGKEGPNTKGAYALTASATREAHRRLSEAGEIPPHWTAAHLQAGVWGSHRRDAEDVFNALKGWRRRVTKDPSAPQPQARKPVITAVLGEMPNDPTTIDPEFDPHENEPDPDLDPVGNEQYWKAHDLREEVEKAKQKDRKKPRTGMLHWAADEDDDFIKHVVNEVTRRYVGQPKPQPKRVPLADCGAPKVHTDDRHLGGDDGCGWGDFCPNSPRNFEDRYRPSEGPPSVMPDKSEMGDLELHPLRTQHLNMLRWAGVQGGDMNDEAIDDDTADEMDDAADVQKDYSQQALKAQDDWYFNQSPPPKSFDDTHTDIPVYMSALPYGTGMLKWSAEAAEEMLHDEPGGALPSTDGEGPSELWESQHAPTAQDPISAGPAGFGAPLDSSTTHEDLGYPERDEAVLAPSGFPGASEGSTINDLADKSYSLDYTSSLDTGSADPGANSRAWLLKGSSPRSIGGDQGIRDADIAAMARQFLDTGELPEGSKSSAKVAAKMFTPAEQQELIQEGSDGVRASNLDRLQLEGTHYLAGEEEEDPDLEGLFG